MKYAVIENNRVVNIIKADGPIDGLEMVEANGAKIGDTYDGQSFGPRPVGEIKSALKQQNTQKRVSLEQAGISYEFPDGTGTAQTRNERDMLNIQGIVSKSQLLQAQGVTDPEIAFRDAENVTHMMTPAQAIAFGEHVADTISGYYQTKWTVEAQIDALETAQEAADFDLEAAWSG